MSATGADREGLFDDNIDLQTANNNLIRKFVRHTEYIRPVQKPWDHGLSALGRHS